MSHHLKLYTERSSSAAVATAAAATSEPAVLVDRLCAAFERAVGRRLKCEPESKETGRARDWSFALPTSSRYDRRCLTLDGHVVDSPRETPAALDDACRLAETLGELLAEHERMQQSLRRCEAELAAGVPIVPQSQPQRHLAERMEAVLKATAEALGCQAAAVYLLDDATTELKLRSAWNLPFDRFLAPARPLQTAAADLEALAGHAVALEDTTDDFHWNMPEQFGAAVCVPVSSPTTPLGTLWVFADTPRLFTDHEVNLVEIGAGRIASDLEREMLLTETHDTARLRRSWDDAGERRRTRVPQIAPLCDGWEIAGGSFSREVDAAAFYDWRMTDDGALCAAVGAVEQTDFSAALEIETLRSLWRAHARHESDPSRLLEFIGNDLWSGSSEPTAAHLLTLRAAADGGLAFAAGGRVQAALLGRDRFLPLDLRGATLGGDLDVGYALRTLRPAQDEVVIVVDRGSLFESIHEIWSTERRRFSGSRATAKFVERCVESIRAASPAGMSGMLLALRRTL
jgi:sigma-B regulation protein RsbU (phosphoserine phosphatase)